VSHHEQFSRKQYQEVAALVQERTAHRPQVGLILGSGLNALADQVEEADLIPFADIPYYAQTSVAGHKGQLVIGRLAGREVLIMQGRIHAYEGISLQRVTLPLRVMNELGIGTLIVTNAA